ncbi:MAG: N-formylglutamate amidohydrolase [Alphaproteobacteria bacterium]
MDHGHPAPACGNPAPTGAPPSLLGPDDPPPLSWLNRDSRRALLIVCDHASNAMPRALGDLGLSAAQRVDHIAWDPGAGAVTRLLSDALKAPAVLAGYSRLVIDCNRAPDDPTAIPQISDGVIVPGNRGLGDGDRTAREAACHRPYHRAIEDWLERALADHETVAMFAVHSFTPSLRDGITRPWDAGVLWTDDARIPVPLMQALRDEPGILVGDNEPYTAHDRFGFTIDVHAEPRGLPNALIEIRQDRLADAAGVQAWAARLARALDPILHRLGI